MMSDSKPAAGNCGANMASGLAQGQLHPPDADAPASEVGAMRDASVNMSGSMCNSPNSPLGKNGDQITLGRRKRARKSTRSSCRQPAASVQQSNAHMSEGAQSVPNGSHVVLTKQDVHDNDPGRDSSSNKPFSNNDVIDLTDD